MRLAYPHEVEMVKSAAIKRLLGQGLSIKSAERVFNSYMDKLAIVLAKEAAGGNVSGGTSGGTANLIGGNMAQQQYQQMVSQPAQKGNEQGPTIANAQAQQQPPQQAQGGKKKIMKVNAEQMAKGQAAEEGLKGKPPPVENPMSTEYIARLQQDAQAALANGAPKVATVEEMLVCKSAAVHKLMDYGIDPYRALALVDRQIAKIANELIKGCGHGHDSARLGHGNPAVGRRGVGTAA